MYLGFALYPDQATGGDLNQSIYNASGSANLYNGVNMVYAAYDPGYTDDEFRWLAEHAGLLILHENYGDRIDFIKKVNPDIKVLCYKYPGVGRDWEPHGCGNYMWIDEKHPEWFLLDRYGERVIDPFNEKHSNLRVYLMDWGNDLWKQYAADHMLKSMSDAKWDGVFLDEIHLKVEERWAPNGIKGYEDDRKFKEAINDFLGYVYGRFQEEGKLLILNSCECIREEGCWASRLEVSDGLLDEGFANVYGWNSNIWRSEEEWGMQISDMELTAGEDKLYLAIAHNRGMNEKDTLYNLASFLMGVNNDKAFFDNDGSVIFSIEYRGRFIDGYRRDYRAFGDIYNVPIGYPLSGRYERDGVWQRDYSNGKVVVNPSSKPHSINLDETYIDHNGLGVDNITLEPHEGLILLKEK